MNFEIISKLGISISGDITLPTLPIQKGVCLFIHGLKGFKEWGPWNLVAKSFASKGLAFVKFDFSHNGVNEQGEFTKKDLFRKNTYSLELDDVKSVIDYLFSLQALQKNDAINKLNIIGHSRGGGIGIINSETDSRVKKLATWASVNDFGYGWSEELKEKWRVKGFREIVNTRTGDILMQDVDLLLDYEQNISILDIKSAAKELDKPWILVHGTEDEVVPFNQAIELKAINKKIKLDLIPNGDHVFGSKHPFLNASLPFDLGVVVDHTISFFLD